MKKIIAKAILICIIVFFPFMKAWGYYTIVEVTFEGTVTNASAYDVLCNTPGCYDDDIGINSYLPFPVYIGDIITGYFQYNLNMSTDSYPGRSDLGVYDDADIKSGFSIGELNVDLLKGPALEGFVQIINDSTAFGSNVTDRFGMREQDSQLNVLTSPVNPESIHYSMMELYFSANYPGGTTLLNSDVMQVMPSTGWEYMSFVWDEYNEELGIELLILADNTDFTVSVSTTVVPEPISTVLFLTGGITLGIRGFMRKKLT